MLCNVTASLIANKVKNNKMGFELTKTKFLKSDEYSIDFYIASTIGAILFKFLRTHCMAGSQRTVLSNIQLARLGCLEHTVVIRR